MQPNKNLTHKQRELLLLLLQQSTQKKHHGEKLANPLMAVLAYQQYLKKNPPAPHVNEEALRLETAANMKRFNALMDMLRAKQRNCCNGKPSDTKSTGNRRLQNLQYMNCMAQDANAALEGLLFKMNTSKV